MIAFRLWLRDTDLARMIVRARRQMAAPILSYEASACTRAKAGFSAALASISRRDRLALIGRKGFGKTTRLKCIATSSRPMKGGGLSSPEPGCAARTDPQRLRTFPTGCWHGPRASPPTRRRRRPARGDLSPRWRPRARRRPAPDARALGLSRTCSVDEPTNHLDLAGRVLENGWSATAARSRHRHDRLPRRLTKAAWPTACSAPAEWLRGFERGPSGLSEKRARPKSSTPN